MLWSLWSKLCGIHRKHGQLILMKTLLYQPASCHFKHKYSYLYFDKKLPFHDTDIDCQVLTYLKYTSLWWKQCFEHAFYIPLAVCCMHVLQLDPPCPVTLYIGLVHHLENITLPAVLRTQCLRWYGHIPRATSCINSITRLGLPGTRDRGRPRKTWSVCVRNDMQPGWCQPVRQEFMENECEVLPTPESGTTVAPLIPKPDMMMMNHGKPSAWWVALALGT